MSVCAEGRDSPLPLTRVFRAAVIHAFARSSSIFFCPGTAHREAAVVVSPDATPLLMTSGNQGFSTGCLCPSQNFQVCDLGLPANAKDGPWAVHVELLKQFQESSVGYASIVSI